ncbi:MAG: hypothetical protein RMJ56_10350 [Gemmataceae bacterium]|nr:hypothetical protein [Gemmata sp.]MDW8197991.1 hypothetical protein [Gemmataceae bacterium]
MIGLRYTILSAGMFTGIVLSVPAQPPSPPSARNLAYDAAAALVAGASQANVVPGTFRAQVVVDNRFKKPITSPDGRESPDPRNRTGKMHCLVCEYGLAPVVAIFLRSDLKNFDEQSGLAKLIQGVDKLVAKYTTDKLSAFAMYLRLEGGSKIVAVKRADGSEERIEVPKEYPDDENRDLYAAEIRGFAEKVPADNVPWGLVPVTSPAIRTFGIPERVPLTVIIYNRFRIQQRWELAPDDLNDDKVREILQATETMVTTRK